MLAAAALSGCESTQERSAQLETKAKREKAAHPALAQKGLSIAHVSTRVKVLAASVVRNAEGAAAVVSLSNTSSRTLRSVPIAVTVKSAGGRTLYRNDAPGLEAGLTRLPSLPAHATVTWVDDQVPYTGDPASVSALVGEAPAAHGPGPRVEVAGVHLTEASTGEVSGTVRNRSSVVQRRLVVFISARRAGKVVAAGRAVLAQVAAGASMTFNAYLIGSLAGARLQASAPASSFAQPGGPAASTPRASASLRQRR